MPIKRPKLIKGEIYHVILRSIENRKIFLDEEDHLRFLFDLAEFNNETVVLDNWRQFLKFKKQYQNGTVGDGFPNKKPLVGIIAICLMPTHVHLLIKQLTDNGISLFCQKLGGYSTYFNKKYHRFGSLFQRPFRVVHIKDQRQLEIVVCYIHTNPVELVEPKWKEGGIRNLKRAEKFIKDYPWSSLKIFLREKSFIGQIINWSLVNELFEDLSAHPDWIKGKLLQKAKLQELLEEFQEEKIQLE